MADVSHNFDSGGWKFTPEVVAVFDEHVSTNVPNYDLIQGMVGHLSDWLAPDGSLVVDVGASTGTTCKRISDRHPDRALTFHLYDVEPDMLEAAAEKVAGAAPLHDFIASQADVTEIVHHEGADLTLCLFVLQFMPTHMRGKALRLLADAARPETGVLLVAEKVEQPTAFWQEVANEATWDFKADHGIPADTIRTKARALRGVLQPMTASGLEALITASGWQPPVQVYRWHSWGLWAARVAPDG